MALSLTKILTDRCMAWLFSLLADVDSYNVLIEFLLIYSLYISYVYTQSEYITTRIDLRYKNNEIVKQVNFHELYSFL